MKKDAPLPSVHCGGGRMTDKELKKLSRGELLQMLVEQSRELDKAQERIGELEEKLQSRDLELSEAGSIAEAALRIHGVFENAQKAADQYLENVRLRSESAELFCQQREQETEQKCQQMLLEAEAACAKSKAEAESYWQQSRAKIEDVLSQHEALKALLLGGQGAV